MKDEGNHHGAVDKFLSEQWIRTVDANYILCEKIGPVHLAEPSLTAGGRQVAVRRNTGEFGNFKKSLYIERFDFLLCLTKVQHHYSSRNAFQVFFG